MMKKKVLAMLLCVFLCLSLVACSNNSNPPKGEIADKPSRDNVSDKDAGDNNAPEEPDAPEEKEPEELTIEEQVIWDQDGVKVTVTGIDAESMMGAELKFRVENNSEQNITLQERNCVVNGYMVDTMMSIDVAAGKKANDTLTILESSLEACGIEQVANIQFNLHYFDSDSWDDINTSETITLETSAAGNYVQKYDDSGFVAYDADGIKVVAKQVVDDDIFGPEAVFYIENNTDKNITVQSRDVSVNGFMVDPSFSADVVAGMKAVHSMTFFSSELEENSIEQIDELEFCLHVFDADTWDTIFDSAPIKLEVEYN